MGVTIKLKFNISYAWSFTPLQIPEKKLLNKILGNAFYNKVLIQESNGSCFIHP